MVSLRDHPRQLVIGIAGGIGSGKSFVAKKLAELAGGVVFDADAVAKGMLDRPSVQRQLIEWWGPEVIAADGRTNRGRIADIVFERPAEKHKLEAIIHPLVRAERELTKERLAGDAAVRCLVMDTPLLFEAGFADDCDRIVFVDADPEVRLQRVRAGRGWDSQEMARREAGQWPVEKKLDLSHDIVDNNAGEAEAVAQIRDLITRILETN